MSVLSIPRRVTPSYKAGYAHNAAESASPGLWPDAGAWVPALGPAGDTLYDLSGNRNDGTLTNMDPAAVWVVGEKGPSLNSASGTDYVDAKLPDLLFDDGVTYVIFSKFVSTEITMDCYDNGTGDRIEITRGTASNQLKFSAWSAWGGVDVETLAADDMEDGDYHLIVGVVSSEKTEIWVDGELHDSGAGRTGLATFGTNNKPFRIGAASTNGANGFIGSFTTASVYKRALSPNEIQHLHVDPLAWLRLKPRIIGYSAAEAPAGGHIMSSLAYQGGLAGAGGIAGSGGGLAG